MSAPATAAGKALLYRIHGDKHQFGEWAYAQDAEALAAIEQQAAAEAVARELERLREAMSQERTGHEAMTDLRLAHRQADSDGSWDIGFHMGWDDAIDHALALLEPEG